MTLDSQPGVLRGHPLAVVFDADQTLAAELHGDGDAPRPRVERILHQLLDDRGRALDDLARRDLIRQVIWQSMNLAHLVPSTRHGDSASRPPRARVSR
jgi:hypothetical protein